LDGEGYEVGLGDFYPCSYFIITAVSNGANLTDGIDGLQQVPQQSFLALGIFYVRLRKYYFL
jgi:UDP-N-acetylmuramyl pentapeptide phosphotransferase/UDP-N-acetylglucosamine-1-phosphate transferase